MTTDRVDIRIDVQQQGAEALAQVNQEIGELSQSAAQSSVAFDRIQQDIREATIAIEQGAISSEDYAQALRFARQEANQLGLSSERLENSIKGIQGRFRATGRETLRDFTRRTEGVSVGLTKVNTTAQRTARQGLGTIRSSMASLTAMAIGTRGTLGTLASGILQFAAGNALAIGAIAGIAAIAFAFRKLSSDAREAKKQIDESIKSLEKLREAEVTPLERVAESITDAQTRLSEMQVVLDRFETLLGGRERTEQLLAGARLTRAEFREDGGADVLARLERVRKLREKMAELEEKIGAGERKRAKEQGKEDDEREATLKTEIGLLTRGLELGILNTEEFKRFGDLLSDIGKQLQADNVTLERQVELWTQLADLAGTIEQRALALPRGAVPIAGRDVGARVPDFGAVPRFELPDQARAAQLQQNRAIQEAALMAAEVLESAVTAQQRYAAQIAMLTAALPNAGAAAGDMAAAIEILKGKLGETADQAEIAAARVVLAFARMAEQMIQGLRGQGGFLSGLIGTVGGLLSVVPGVGQLAGAGILAGTGILSALARPSRDPMPVSVDQFGPRAIKQQSDIQRGPDNVIVQVISPLTGEVVDEIIYTINRRERTDSFERIPRFTGAITVRPQDRTVRG